VSYIGFDEEARKGWVEFLMEFESTVFPTFYKFGYGKNTALQVWMLNALANEVADSRSTFPHTPFHDDND
jgi:hypothetical protein